MWIVRNSGCGGMINKIHHGPKTAQLGIAVHIANGTKDNILTDLLSGDAIHTRFVPDKGKSGKKKWIAHSEHSATGMVSVNEGAKAALISPQSKCLLPVGIVKVLADFNKGEIIKLMDEQDKLIGLGIAEYGSDKAKERIGQKNQKPLVHYDYLYLQN